MRKKLAAGNWKMNGSRAALSELTRLRASHSDTSCEILVCPPATHIVWALETVGAAPIRIGAQDCHANASGPHTGDISAAQLADAGAAYVILGHSERRADHGETDALIAEKARAAHLAGLTAIICVGETEGDRDAGETLRVIGQQLGGSLPNTATPANTVIAYEPVWAIGSGRTPTLDQIAEVHHFLRAELGRHLGPVPADGVRILYGGSVKPDNAAAIFAVPDVDGALVGGASLKAADFGQIITALSA